MAGSQRAIDVFAPAKVNLTLHVTGQRADGYHLLDSLVMLMNVGDHLKMRTCDKTNLSVTGPHADGVPTDADNLVVRAADLMGVSADITLHKALPAAAGIGGGSSDAAACLRGLSLLSGAALPTVQEQLSLGADVPVCMHTQLVHMQGIGEQLTLLGEPPNWAMIMINPRIQVPTGQVFDGLANKNNAPMSSAFPKHAGTSDQVNWLWHQRNDLEPAAVRLAPIIGDVLAALRRDKGCLLARMSGSGATCFAIMADEKTRDAAVASLRLERPDWWIVPAEKCGGSLI